MEIIYKKLIPEVISLDDIAGGVRQEKGRGRGKLQGGSRPEETQRKDKVCVKKQAHVEESTEWEVT